MSSADDVHVGFWTDYGQPSGSRARLTLTSNQSNLLLIALSVLTGVTGEYLWQILCQLLFLRRATDAPRDGLFHQIQLYLRNDDSPGEFSWNVLRLSHAWAKRRRDLRWRALRWALFGLAMLTLNMSSSFWLPVLSNEGEVLLKPVVNYYNWTSATNMPSNETQKNRILDEFREEYNLFLASQAKAWAAYTDSCYPSLTFDSNFAQTGANMCNLYKHKYLNSSVSFPGVCPFGQDLCSVPLDQVIRVDSGRINSHDHLGLNTPPDARVDVQMTLTCSPIRTEGFVTPNFEDHNGINDTLIFSYGHNDLAYNRVFNDPAYNWTADQDSNITFFYTKARLQAQEGPLSIDAASEDQFSSDDGQPQFNLLSNLRTSDAPATLLFLSTHVAAYRPINDPWFNMTTSVVISSNNNTYYTAAQPVSVVGCIQTHSFCNPSAKDVCVTTNTVRPQDPTFAVNGSLWGELGFNREQRLLGNFMAFLQRALVLGELNWSSPDVLLASHLYSTLDQNDFNMPDNHWQREVQHWMNNLLSRAQGEVMTIVEKPVPIAVRYSAVDVGDDLSIYLMKRVKVRAHGFQSFSVVALALVISIQGFIILCGLYAQFIWPWLRLRNLDDSPHQYRRYKLWQLMGAAQLHRCLHQLLGRGRWRGAWHEIPTTDPKSEFGEYGRLPWQPYVTLEQERALTSGSQPFSSETIVVSDRKVDHTKENADSEDTPGAGTEKGIYSSTET